MNGVIKQRKRVCYVGTVYSLLLYLLHSSLEEINNTYFLFAYGIPVEICKRFEHYRLLFGDYYKLNTLQRFLNRYSCLGWINHVVLRFQIYIKVRGNFTLYAQDHLTYSNAIIGSKRYVLIEDSKYNISNVRKGNFYHRVWKKKQSWKYPLFKFFYGNSLYGVFGRNSSCTAVLMSELDDDEILNDKESIVCRLEEAWENAVKEKKDFINFVFNFTNEDFCCLRENCNVLFTQCLYPDVLNKEEHYTIYARILSDFNNAKITIKTHPRDIFPYEEYFKNIYVYRKVVPAQLLSLNGIIFHDCITVFSSSIQDIKHTGSLFWYGTEINKKLYHIIGHIDAPKEAIVVSKN